MLELAIQIQNTVWNTIVLTLAVWETLCRYAKVNYDLTTQLSIIITGLLTPNIVCNVEEYFKDGSPESTIQSRNEQCGTNSDV